MGPLLPPFLAFASGIFLGDRLGVGFVASLAGLAASVAVVTAIYSARAAFSALGVVPLFFFLGSLFVIPYSSPEAAPGHLVDIVRKDPLLQRAGILVEGTVEAAESTGRRTRVWLEADGVVDGAGRRGASGLVLLSVNGHADLLPGDKVRVLATLSEPYTFGNPGEFDYRLWLKRRGVLVTGYVKSEKLIERLAQGSGPSAIVQRARGAVASLIDRSGAAWPEPLKALVISGQGGIDRELREAFASTGTAHILSISGLHVGMVAAFSYWAVLFLLRRSERALLAFDAKRAALVIAAFPTVAYALLAGLPVATQRSVVMALAFIASFAMGRGKDHLNTLSLAGLVILAVSPGALWDVSFQLSFAAMASIIILVPVFKRPFGEKAGDEDRKEGVKAAVRRFAKDRVLPLVFVTLAAGVGTSPILAYHFHRVSLAGLAGNLVAVPLAGLIVPFLLASSAMLAFSETLAWALLFPADLAFSAVAYSVRLMASIPYASLWVSPPSLHELALYYSAIFMAVNMGRNAACRYGAPALGLLLVWLHLYGGLKGPAGELRVTFLSVGQGDAAFAELPGGKTMLVDGGGTSNPDFDVGERVIAPFLRSKGVERIDYMVLSHAQRDHMGGLLFLARNMEVGEFWWNGQSALGPLGAALDAKGVLKRVVNSSVGKIKADGASVEFFNPPGGLGIDVNDNSVVMRLSFGERSLLFSGDIGENAEKALASREIGADVLKAPHHGSRYSSSGAFLSAVRPSAVVVSAGRFNSFGFPHAEALERYREAGAEVLRTDTMGAVTVETDGRALRKKAYLTGNGL